MSSPEPLASVLHPGRVLTSADVERLRALLPPSVRRAAQLDARDAAIRECFAETGESGTAAARQIEHALGRWLASGWRLEVAGAPHRPDPPGLAGAIRRLARANGGEALGVRQLLNVLGGRRR